MAAAADCGGAEARLAGTRPTEASLAGTRPAEVRLGELRASIDNIDAALVHLLAERFKFTQRVGHLKADAGLAPADPAREARQIARLRALADESGLDPVFAEKFLGFIVAEVIHHHEAIAETR
ncbi:MAG: chorismate mutase [Bifidobacteriaceae bacterium]|nr:chorismate mutase [Bifidobacteriaceae bacterium]